jgi:hypothetical protein
VRLALGFRHAGQTGVTISCYEDTVPSFVEGEMERLYQNTFSSVAAEHVGDAGTSTYVVRLGARAVTVFLFRRQKGRIRVLNSVIRITAQEIRQFSEYIFKRYLAVHVIDFVSIQTEILRRPFLCQQLNASEDIVLVLPGSAQAYVDSLGKTTRKRIRRSSNRVKRSFPDLEYHLYEARQIDDWLVGKIIAMKMARMHDKNEICGIDDEQKDWIGRIAKSHGFVGVASISGRLCSGVICSQMGANYFMHVIAHDSEYDPCSLGLLSCYWTVCEAIARGGKEFHFLWGQGRWKDNLCGEQTDLDNVAVYRSRVRYIFDLDTVLRNICIAHIRKLKHRAETAPLAFWLRRIGAVAARLLTIRK